MFKLFRSDDPVKRLSDIGKDKMNASYDKYKLFLDELYRIHNDTNSQKINIDKLLDITFTFTQEDMAIITDIHKAGTKIGRDKVEKLGEVILSFISSSIILLRELKNNDRKET